MAVEPVGGIGTRCWWCRPLPSTKTGLVIGLPMTTAADNATTPFAIAVGSAAGRKAGKTSCVLCQPKSLDWRVRRAKPHPPKRLAGGPFLQACEMLTQIVALT